MKASARNQFNGIVNKVVMGSVNAEVFVSLKGGETLVASITNESIDTLGIKEGIEVLALVKAPQILLVSNFGDFKVSARNQLNATITHVKPGTVNAEVVMELRGGNLITATVTNDSVETLGLVKGAVVTAIFKAGAVILAVKS